MKALFLTSWIGGCDRNDELKRPTKLNNINGFVSRLHHHCSKIEVITYVASNPSDFEKCDEHSLRLMANLKLEGFEPKKMYVVDNRFNFDLQDVINNSDMVFLAGGHVPTQNKFFKKIGLKEVLQNYNGVVVGQSAGSMNCAELVYVPPEEPEDFADPNFQRTISGLGLTKYNIMPHINYAFEEVYNGITQYDMCIDDSKQIYHYGIVDGGFVECTDGLAVAYGETYLFRDGLCKKLCENKQCVELNEFYEHK